MERLFLIIRQISKLMISIQLLNFSVAGNYTEALSDAEITIGLQPSFLKAFVRGKITGQPNNRRT